MCTLMFWSAELVKIVKFRAAKDALTSKGTGMGDD